MCYSVNLRGNVVISVFGTFAIASEEDSESSPGLKTYLFPHLLRTTPGTVLAELQGPS